jgi:hypothetical protein
MAEDETDSETSSASSDSSDSDDSGIDDMGVRLVARSADGTKLINTLDVFPRFELSL